MQDEAKRVAIIGSGVVGEATGKGFIAKGVDLLFSDISPIRLEALHAQGLTAVLPEELRTKAFDISFLSISTPTKGGQIVLDHLYAAAEEIGTRLKTWPHGYHLVVVRSTVPPGTTEILGQLIAKLSGKRLGEDFGLCMNPEFLREKTAAEDFLNPPIIVIGEYDERSGAMLDAFYRKRFSCPIFRVSLKEAEMEKYIHNLYNAAKISFFNEFRLLCTELGIDAERVFPLVAKSAEGMLNPAYGTRNFGPFDGMCLPKDTSAFLSWAKEQGFELPMLKATIVVNKTIKKQTALEGLEQPSAVLERQTTLD